MGMDACCRDPGTHTRPHVLRAPRNFFTLGSQETGVGRAYLMCSSQRCLLS